MSLEALVARFGLGALFLGAGLEGETAVVAGGLLAHRGYFPLAGAMIAASTGSMIADQLFFVIGRSYRESRLARWARGKAAYARALRLMERYPAGFIFAFRFIYGMRTVSPFAIGTSQVAARTFILVNIVAAIVWACTFTLVGYLFGRAFERWLDRLAPDRSTLLIAGGVVAALLVGWQAIRWWRRQRPAA